MKFSEKLQKLRKDNNLSQEQLADKLDVSRQSVSKWESGQTYPEMDKLLTMCKIFNITLDDLTNDEIKYNEVRTKNTNAFSNLIDDLVYIIDKSFSMFKGMSSKTRGKVIGELIILFLILLLFRIPFAYIENIGYNLGISLPRGTHIFISLWSFIINAIYLILFIFTYLYIYKTHYLDKYKEETKDNIIEKTEILDEKVENETEENRIIKEKKVHKEKHREHSHFGGTLFIALGKVTSFCVKGFLGFLCFPFILTLITIFLCGTLMIGLTFKGIIYFGIILLIIAGSVLNVILLQLMISFICNLKVNAKLLLIIFITGLGLIGIGSGITLIEFANTEFIDEVPNSKFEFTTKTVDYQMSDNLIISDHYYIKNILVDETLTDTVKVEIKYYKDLLKVQPVENEYYGYNIVEFWENGIWNKKIIDLFLSNLKDKKIYDYSKLYDFEINVYTSSANIEKLSINKQNLEQKREEYIEDSYDNEIYDLNANINSLNNKIDSLENEIERLENINEELKDENDTLKDKINEYKNNLQNILD